MTGREVIASCSSCGHTGDCGCSCCTAGPCWRAPSQPLRPAADLPAAVVAMYSRVMADWGYTSPPPVTVDDARRVLAKHQPART